MSISCICKVSNIVRPQVAYDTKSTNQLKLYYHMDNSNCGHYNRYTTHRNVVEKNGIIVNLILAMQLTNDQYFSIYFIYWNCKGHIFFFFRSVVNCCATATQDFEEIKMLSNVFASLFDLFQHK